MAREPIPRGKYIGKADVEPENDAAHFFPCAECGGWVDMRDLGAVFDHDVGGSHPKTDGPQ